MTPFLATVLEGVSRAAGVRGALLVSAEDGLVVAESAMEGLESASVAALAGSLAIRLLRAADAAGQSPPALIHMEATEGALFIAVAEGGLLLVAVTAPDVNAGQVRLLLLNAAGQLG